ncbi:response regulator [Caenispirillum salinarum]|uniref:response regulator transcription factor n=1 Tax=Caenispirillum salinarum TaxID=859058 RepID=UPI00384AE95D
MRIVIADDHSIVRTGLRHLLAEATPKAEVVEAASGDNLRSILAAVAEQGATSPDLLILDLKMPGIRSLEDVREIVQMAGRTPVLVFSMLDQPDEMRAVLAQGVKAFVPKSTDQKLLANIISLVLAGGTYLPPVLGGLERGNGDGRPVPLHTSAGRFMEGALDTLPAGLTKRQQDVLRLLAEGLSNQEIGERMGLNLSTVKSHVTGILKALNVGSRTQAVLALRRSRDTAFSDR